MADTSENDLLMDYWEIINKLITVGVLFKLLLIGVEYSKEYMSVNVCTSQRTGSYFEKY